MNLLPRLAFAAALVAAAPAQSQERLSLLERMNLLENQISALQRTSSAAAPQPQQNVELLNRLSQLQGEIQGLRSQIEQLQNENQQLKQAGRDQYVDIDTRLAKLEGAPAAVAAAPAPAPASVFSDVTPAQDKAAKEAAAYEEAYKALIEKGEAAEASRLFQVFLREYPDGELASNAWYWLGESYYVTQNYPLALESFQTVTGQFPDSRKVPDAMLKTGYCQIELKQFGEGLGTLNKLITDHAGHPAADMAINRLRGLSLDQQR